VKILVVDDDPFACRILAQQLRNLGYDDVTPNESARAALEEIEARADAFGLLFLDLQMPDIDGVQFVRHLGRVGYAGALVLVSGEDRRVVQAAERLATEHRLDVLGALNKPVSPVALQEVLESNLLRNSASERPRRSYDAKRLAQAVWTGELVNHYQPKVSLRDGAVVGMEVLVRWRHPEDGLVFPDEFIPLAEEHNLIDALAFEVIKNALDRSVQLRSCGVALPMAVNVSMENLRNLAFPERLLGLVEGVGLTPSAIVLEVTESRLMTDPLVPLDVLTRLRLKRFDLSIDDFGTGHSSLAQLRDLPFQELKVDRGFVHRAGDNPVAGAILRASVEMAGQLGMTSVAEGVEDAGDWRFLRHVGCDVGQGYFIGRPMAGDRIDDWLAAWALRRAGLTDDAENLCG
jgi:EAL domain-containing protein (putative c-di-GMP-specific phosphodiesterase class I)/CheY-like chemotaxis protein